MIAGASALFNILVFAGSAYMMLVYDSVLPSRSIPTLLGLFMILTLIYVFQFVFDTIRGDALQNVANGAFTDLSPATGQAASSRRLKLGSGEGDGVQLHRDLDQVHAFLSSPGPTAFMDLPWVVVFLVILFMLHWWLGLTALAGVIVLALIALWTSRRTQSITQDLVRIGNFRAASRLSLLRFGEAALAMGMGPHLRHRSSEWEADYLATQNGLGRLTTQFGGAGRIFRLFLQSLILTVGALLVLDDKASGGVILASSVLSGRALAPVDLAIANWRGYAAARAGWTRIVEAITQFPIPGPRSISLPPPQGEILVRDVAIVPPGASRPVVAGVNLILRPGEALALIGPSASGKSTLAKGLLGIWPTARGEIRIDGATHDQWDSDVLGTHFGYVPQNVELLDGTIGENIARFDPARGSTEIIAAATAAGMHETILAFEDGYDTRLSAGGGELSAGQRQRIGLARALYGNPHLVVLDEANSNLDAAGDAALAAAIMAVRERKGIVVLITHRPATLGPVTHLAVLNAGKLTDYGERDAVLKRAAPPAPPAKRSAKPAGAPA